MRRIYGQRFTQRWKLILFRGTFVHAFAPPRRGTSGLFLQCRLKADQGAEVAQRKPKFQLAWSGVVSIRSAERTTFPSLFHEPPRSTRSGVPSSVTASALREAVPQPAGDCFDGQTPSRNDTKLISFSTSRRAICRFRSKIRIFSIFRG